MQLFSRAGRSLAITNAGRELYVRAIPLLSGGRQLIESVRQAARPEPAPFVVGHTAGISSDEVHRIIAPVAAAYPSQQFMALPVYMGNIRAALLNGTIDVALRVAIECPPGQEGTVIAHSPLRAAISVTHPLSSRSKIGTADLAPYPIIVWQQRNQSIHTDFIVTHCRRAGFDPGLIVTNTHGTRPCTAADTHPGAAVFVTDSPGLTYNGRVRVIEITDPPVAPIQATWLPHVPSPLRDILTSTNQSETGLRIVS